jgi:predicted RNase H-like HicB family nuclease
MQFHIEFEQEGDGRWIAEIHELPGVIAYGATQKDAESKVEQLALRVVADKLKRENSTLQNLQFGVA